jgi:hypothetical protein
MTGRGKIGNELRYEEASRMGKVWLPTERWYAEPCSEGIRVMFGRLGL